MVDEENLERSREETKYITFEGTWKETLSRPQLINIDLTRSMLTP